MTYQDKIQNAKARLMLEHPYFGTIASALTLEKSDNIEAFLSDGDTLQYNDEYFDSVGVEEVEFALANGAMHTVLKHEKRAEDRYEWLWQLATDYTINSMLVNNGLSLPDRANFQDRFKGMYAEEVYEILRSEITNEELSTDENLKDQAHDEQGRTNKDHVSEKEREPEKDEDRPKETASSATSRDSSKTDATVHDGLSAENNDENEMSPEEEKQMAEAFFEQLFKKMNRQGTLPKDLKFLVPRYFSHQVDWREMLYRYIASYAKSSFSFMPPNMKYLYRGIYLPSLSSDLLRIVIAIDSSGSVDEKLLGLFLGEVESITQQYSNYEIDIIIADAKIHSHEVFLPGEPLNYEIKGGGGTDFRPVFEYVDRSIDYPTLLLYFTDGMGTFPSHEPPYDMIWVMPEICSVPFGEVLQIEL
ncbi:MAG: VWA-like domain-containing protein [Campylobacterota bacterium]|nr:VWA-like domain-containing protein [Campylobacterota bacterium]